MVDGRIIVKIVRDEDGNLMFEFPEEKDRAKACFKLAQIALENKRNAEYKRGDGIGHLRNLFLGSTMSRLQRMWFEPNDTIYLAFMTPGYPKDEEVIVLKRKTEEMTFIIGED
ncbi:hypothetical protein IKG06_03455 [Candidatus Saccharibacteria bacterium]|nr:hypothetical protein [Candidatus Saccharibacteria bacterium]